MSDKTGIEWTDSTWNPTVGCTKVSAGCDHCYAETLVNRFAPSKGFPERFDTMVLRDDRFVLLPLSKKWATPRRVFVNSLSDLFHDDVPVEFIARVFAVMSLAGQHTYQLLTKRHARMKHTLNAHWFRVLVDDQREEIRPGCGDFTWPLLNVWLGVSVENQQWADIRIPALLDTPAAVRFLSCEPLLGRVNLIGQGGDLRGAGVYSLPDPPDYDGGEPICQDHGVERCRQGCTFVDWVIVGGESGRGARPMDVEWARSLRDQCEAAGVPFLFKQWGGKTPKSGGRILDGRTWDEYPAGVA